MTNGWRKAAALGLGLMLTLGLAVGPQAAAAGTPVTVSTPTGTLPAGSAVVRGGTTYVSLRAICEAMGAQSVTWQNSRAEAHMGDYTLTAAPGEQYISANGRYFYIPGGVELAGGTVTVPLRAAASAMGAEASWKPGEVTVTRSTSTADGEEHYNSDVLYWLSRVISAESRGECLDGQIAVGNVVLNRVASPEFPNTVYGVIFDMENGVQFEPVANGTIYNEPTPLSVAAAKLVLEGANTAGDSLYFFAPALSEGKWIVENRTYSHTIGCHRFYL